MQPLLAAEESAEPVVETGVETGAETTVEPVAVEAAAADPAINTSSETPQAELVVSPPDINTLMQNLTQASLSEAIDIVDQLEELGGRTMLPLFQSMMDGELYFEKTTLQMARISKDAAGVDIVTDPLSGDPIADINQENLDKIRVNNRLRGQLREAVGRINLMEGSDDQRLAAAISMLSSVDEDSKPLLQEAAQSEMDEEVLAVINVALAMIDLKTTTEDQVRIDAISKLDGRLEGPVRNLLGTFTSEGGNNTASPEVRTAAFIALENIESRVKFYQLIEQLFFGLSLGSVLLLAAIGLAVTFGVMGVINMAHGEMLMLGAYTTYVVQQLMPQSISASIWVSLPAAFIVTALVGILIQRYVIRYLAGRPLETLLATFGISLILQETVRTIFSPLNRRVLSPDWMSGSWQYNAALSLTNNRIYILLFSLLVFAALLFILKKTSLGLNVRAVSQNRAMAKAMGIRTDFVDAMTFGLGSGIAGIAGVALSQLTNVGPNLGGGYIIDSFMVVVFGGVGNLFGTLLAAFSLGMVNKFLEPATGAVLANILILVFIILFIQKRPKGLFPQRGRSAE
ncbi:MAG: urea ABC transporter permease subunit UrtB [Pseudomonadota bacterium]